MFTSNIVSSVNLSLPCRLLFPSAVGYHLVHMSIPLIQSLSQVSYIHCAMTVPSSGVWPPWRQDRCLHLWTLIKQGSLRANECIELVQVPKRALGDGAGVLFSFVMDAPEIEEDFSFLGYLLILLFWGSFLLLKFSLIIYKMISS